MLFVRMALSVLFVDMALGVYDLLGWQQIWSTDHKWWQIRLKWLLSG